MKNGKTPLFSFNFANTPLYSAQDLIIKIFLAKCQVLFF